MAARQRTFELIPSTPAGLYGPAGFRQPHPAQAHARAQPVYTKPPMTTRQAKRLHRQANKGSKLSKAEQRCIDLMEQDRIRKEFEKEKAQARARTAREKKKAREEQERDERKRKGLPLVDVHPSQDTISRFIKIGKRQAPSAMETHFDGIREQDSEADPGAESAAEAQYGREYDASGKDNPESVTDGSETGRRCKKPLYGQLGGANTDELDLRTGQHSPGTVATMARQLEADSHPPHIQVGNNDAWDEGLLEDQLAADIVLTPFTNAEDQGPAEECLAVVTDLAHTHPSTAYLMSASTQAFLLDNADDIFPSLSQQARELADSLTDDGGPSPPEHQSQPSGIHVDTPSHMSLGDGTVMASHALIETMPPPPRPLFSAAKPPAEFPCPSLEESILLSQDYRDIDTSGMVRGPSMAEAFALLVEEEQKSSCSPKKHWREAAGARSQIKDEGDPHHELADPVMHAKECRKGSGVESSAAGTAGSCISKARPDQQGQSTGRSGPSDHQNVTTRVRDSHIKPQPSPAKKRMFGPSGPGPEGLVAMERSHEQNRQEKRVRKQNLCAQDWPRQLHRDMIERAGVSPEGVVGGVCAPQMNDTQSSRGKEEAAAGATYQGECSPQETRYPHVFGNPSSSQETDYGDIDMNAGSDVLGILMRIEEGQRT